MYITKAEFLLDTDDVVILESHMPDLDLVITLFINDELIMVSDPKDKTQEVIEKFSKEISMYSKFKIENVAKTIYWMNEC